MARRWATQSTGRGRWTSERSADRGATADDRTRPAHPSLGAARLDHRARPAGGLGRVRLAQPRHRPGDRAAPRGGGARLRPHHRPGPRGLRRVPPGHRRALEREPRLTPDEVKAYGEALDATSAERYAALDDVSFVVYVPAEGTGRLRGRRAGRHTRVRGHATAQRAGGLLPGHGHVERPADPCRARPGGRPGPSGRLRGGPRLGQDDDRRAHRPPGRDAGDRPAGRSRAGHGHAGLRPEHVPRHRRRPPGCPARVHDDLVPPQRLLRGQRPQHRASHPLGRVRRAHRRPPLPLGGRHRLAHRPALGGGAQRSQVDRAGRAGRRLRQRLVQAQPLPGCGRRARRGAGAGLPRLVGGARSRPPDPPGRQRRGRPHGGRAALPRRLRGRADRRGPARPRGQRAHRQRRRRAHRRAAASPSSSG